LDHVSIFLFGGWNELFLYGILDFRCGLYLQRDKSQDFRKGVIV
jgi:hypothetical protein